MTSGRNDDLEWLYRRDHDAAVNEQAGQGRNANDPPTQSDLPPTQPLSPRQQASRPTPPVRPAPPSPAPPSPAPPRPAPPPAQPKARKRKRPARNVFRLVSTVLVLWLIFTVVTPFYAWGGTTKVDTWPTGQRPPEQPGKVYLLVGSDSREGLSDEERKRLGTGAIEGQRTDTIMLMVVPVSGKPALVSIPRDSYVPIPGHGKNKINAAFAFGGPKLLVQTVEQNTGLRIDGYVEIGFGGFVGVVDALGGVEMCPKKAIKDKNSHLDIPAGCQNMDGVTALGYARMRYADPTGDLGRMNRQRELVTAIIKKSASPWTVINPVRWWGVNTGAAKSVRFDEGGGVMTMASLAGPASAISKGEGYLTMVPISNPNATTAAGSSMLWNTKKAKEMFDQLAKGDTTNLDRFTEPI